MQAEKDFTAVHRNFKSRDNQTGIAPLNKKLYQKIVCGLWQSTNIFKLINVATVAKKPLKTVRIAKQFES